MCLHSCSSTTISNGDRICGDEIRDDLTLPYLDLPSRTKDLAKGYRLGDMERGYRILSRAGHGPGSGCA